MHLHILSDLHTEWGDFKVAKLPARPDAIALAGDIGIAKQGLEFIKRVYRDIPVLYVLGNHEYWGQDPKELLAELKSETKDSNIFVLERDAVEVKGVTFLGTTLWTDFAILGDRQGAISYARESWTDFMVIRPGEATFSPEESLAWHQESVAWLRNSMQSLRTRKTVVLSHHAPSRGSILPAFALEPTTPVFVSDLDAVIRAGNARLWVHGHTHTRFDYHVGVTRVVCNPFGYAPGKPVDKFDPNLVIEI